MKPLLPSRPVEARSGDPLSWNPALVFAYLGILAGLFLAPRLPDREDTGWIPLALFLGLR